MKSFNLFFIAFAIVSVSIANIYATSSPCLMEILRNIFSSGPISYPDQPPYGPNGPNGPSGPSGPSGIYGPDGIYPPYNPYRPYPWNINPTNTTSGPATPATLPPTCAPCQTAPAVVCPACTTSAPVTCPPPPPTQIVTYGSSLPCGTFLQYDIANSSVVAANGFSAGIYKDGTQAYVGMGINHGCANEFNCPGRIAVTGSQGVYMSCQNGVLDPYATRFLVDHPNLHWVSMAGQTLLPTSNLVSVKSTSSYLFFIGRANLTVNGQTYTVVSKVFNNGVMLYSDGTSTGYQSTANIEVLSC